MARALHNKDGVLCSGYEDKGTWREMASAATPSSSPPARNNLGVPLLMVCVTELPANTDTEVELTCASRQMRSYLGLRTGSWAPAPRHDDNRPRTPERGLLWDTGHNSAGPPAAGDGSRGALPRVKVLLVTRLVGHGCACVRVHGDGVVEAWQQIVGGGRG